MTEHDEFTGLLKRVGQGVEEAERELLQRCGPLILRIVRRRLNRELRSQFDSDDFVQSVWQAFFEHRSAVMRFDGQESLVAFLARIASNKIIDACRRRLRKSAEYANRECSLENPNLDSHVLATSDPTPSEVVMAAERLDNLVENAGERQMLRLRATGKRFGEIAAELGVSERTVRRVFDKLKKRNS
ncbi:MAG: sigma-70 family RNA polymerase sigma factor [Planctomycetota bacterium]|nr:sigma-70 family RNA polymerase sigma factor [Planctomycetota bacterium]